MMSNVLEYRGYLTRIEYSVDDHVLYGKIEGIKDLVNFESDTVAGVEAEFHSAVDDYLALCAELGETPDRAYSGTFNVRISTALHRKLAMHAIRHGESLNSAVEAAIQEYVDEGSKATQQLVTTIRRSISPPSSYPAQWASESVASSCDIFPGQCFPS